jgi:Mannose-6-phosphate isomerase
MKPALIALIALLGGGPDRGAAAGHLLERCRIDGDAQGDGEGRARHAHAPVQNTDHYRINVVERTKPQGAIAHPGFIEVHHIISGAGTLVTGGTIVRAAGAAAGSATIEGGQTRHVAKGDVVLVPAGAPHWYKDLEGTLTYLEVRFQEIK